MKTCPENCDASCYRCLRSFKNKFEHIDSSTGMSRAELLEFLITGALPDFDRDRLKESTLLLYNDLLRQGHEEFDFKLNASVTPKDERRLAVPILATAKGGRQTVIALSAPLAINHADAESVRELQDTSDDIQVVVVNELLVRGNLPAATREVQQRLFTSN